MSLTRLKFLALCLLLLIIFGNIDASYYQWVQSEPTSPSFTRQEIIDDQGVWQLWKGFRKSMDIYTHDNFMVKIPMAENLSACGPINSDDIRPDIESVSYVSDGRKLNSTLWLTNPFKQPNVNDTLDKDQENMQITISYTNYNLSSYTILEKAKIGSPSILVNDIKIGSLPFKKIAFLEESEYGKLKIIKLWTVHKQKAYSITYSVLNTTYVLYADKIDRMFNSFRILDKLGAAKNDFENSNITKDFLTYANDEIRIDYPSGWTVHDSQNTLQTTITFEDPFEDTKSKNVSWHEPVFTMAIDLESVYDAGTDYRIIYSRIPNETWGGGNWTTQLQEVSALDKVNVQYITKNDWMTNKNNTNFIPFSIDLKELNFPTRYKIVFLITDNFVINHHFCRLVDTSNWIVIPPPDFSLSATPGSLSLRPGDKAIVSLGIKGNSDLQSQAYLTGGNKSKYVIWSFIPNSTAIPVGSVGISNLNIEVPKDLELDSPTPVNIPINASISFPSSITNRGGETFSNDKSVNLFTTSNFTLTILPPLNLEEKVSIFTKNWIEPMTGVWTLLAGIGGVTAPLIVHFYRKKKTRRHRKNKIKQ